MGNDQDPWNVTRTQEAMWDLGREVRPTTPDLHVHFTPVLVRDTPSLTIVHLYHSKVGAMGLCFD